MTKLIILALLLSLYGSGARMEGEEHNVVLIDVREEITTATKALISGGLKLAEDMEACLVIITLNTPGGEVGAVKDIAEMFINSRIPVCCYVHPSGATAWSGGTYLLMASHIAAMAPGTVIGSCQPVMGAIPINWTKYVNAMSELLSEYARLRSRNETAARLFVTENLNLGPEGALKSNVIDFIAIDVISLLSKIEGSVLVRIRTNGFAATELVPASSIPEGAEVLATFTGVGNARIVSYGPDPGTVLLRYLTNPLICELLMIIGITALIIGLQTPGIGMELAGSIMVLLGLMGLGVVGLDVGVIILLAMGAGLVIGELMTQQGLLGIGSIACFTLGGLLSLSPTKWLIPSHIIANLILSVSLTASAMGCILALVAYKTFRTLRAKPKVGPEAMIGLKGISLTDVDAGGEVRVCGEVWRARSSGGKIREGSSIKVVGRDGLVLIVEEC